MHLDVLKAYLLSKTAAREEMPFGADVLIYKVCGKMFALVSWQELPLSINLKCDPEQAEILRTLFSSIKPGYHMNKRHWNTLTLEGELTDGQIEGFIDDSYELVLAKLTKRERLKLSR